MQFQVAPVGLNERLDNNKLQLLYNSITQMIGHPERGTPPSLMQMPRFGNLTTDRFLQNVFNSFAGMHWKSTQILIEDITVWGKWMRRLFPIMTWKRVQELYPDVKETQRGESYEMFSEWKMQVAVMGDASRRAPSAILEASRRIAQTRTFHFKGSGYRLPMDFVLDETKFNKALKEQQRMALSIYKTLEHELISSCVDEAIRWSCENEMEFFPNLVTHLETRLDKYRENMFILHKKNGMERLETEAVQIMANQAITIDTLITSNATRRFLKLTNTKPLSYADRGPPANDMVEFRSSLDPEGAGRTPVHNLQFVASIPFVMAEDVGRVDDPTLVLCKWGLFYNFNHTAEHFALTNYRNDDRNIRVVDIHQKVDKTLSWVKAIQHDGLFRVNPSDNGLDNTSKYALMVLSGVMKPAEIARAEDIIRNTTERSRFLQQPNDFLRRRQRDGPPGFTEADARQWQTNWEERVTELCRSRIDVGTKQMPHDMQDEDGSWDPLATHPADGLPNVANMYTMIYFAGSNWLRKMLDQLRTLPDVAKDQWRKIRDNQYRGGRSGGAISAASMATSSSSFGRRKRKALGEMAPQNTVKRPVTAIGTEHPHRDVDTTIRLELPNDTTRQLVPVDLLEVRETRHMFSYEATGCGSSADRYVKLQSTLRNVVDELFNTSLTDRRDIEALWDRVVQAAAERVRDLGFPDVKNYVDFVRLNAVYFGAHYLTLLQQTGLDGAKIRENKARLDRVAPRGRVDQLGQSMQDFLDDRNVDITTGNQRGMFDAQVPIRDGVQIAASRPAVAGGHGDWSKDYPFISLLFLQDDPEISGVSGSLSARDLQILETWAQRVAARRNCVNPLKEMTLTQGRHVGAYIWRILHTDMNADHSFVTTARANMEKDDINAVLDTIVRMSVAQDSNYYDVKMFGEVYPGETPHDESTMTDDARDAELKSWLQDTRICNEFRNWCLSYNIYWPMNYVAFQPDITLSTYSNVFCKSGPETAALAIKDPAVMWTPEASIRTIHVECLFRCRLVVKERRNFLFIPHTSIAKYHGGGGTDFVDYHAYNEAQSRNLEPSPGHGLFIVPLRADEELTSSKICTTGEWHPALVGTNVNPLQYSTASFAARRYNFAHHDHHLFSPGHYPPDPQGFGDSAVKCAPNNELCFRASWFECESRDGKSSLTMYKQGENPIGHNITAQSARVVHCMGDAFDETLGDLDINGRLANMQSVR